MEAVCARDGIPVRKTKKDQTALDKDACATTGDLVLKDYSGYVTLGDTLNRGIKALSQGTVYPIHTRYDMAESGRRTSSSPNVQNWGRKAGPRECFIPRPGKVFVQGDYPQLELRTLAQVCLTRFGHSKLAEALNAGLDPHSMVAAKMLGKSYEYIIEHQDDHDAYPEVYLARQSAKVANFGLPGGLGVKRKKDGSPSTLILFARKAYDTIITDEQALQIGQTYFETWPEMEDFFAYHRSKCANAENLSWIRHIFSERMHGGCRFTAACNADFQGLGADAAGRAGFLLARACYVGPGPLLGTRPVLFVHDEFIGETDDGPSAHEAAMEWGQIMSAGAKEFLPDVNVKVKPQLMRVWSKAAKQVFVDGRLVPWEPKVT
jgi:DNA polymerase I-like protein with 3'-5' exonuclease and polymerase domains